MDYIQDQNYLINQYVWVRVFGGIAKILTIKS